ncbi:hypothetical protein [Shimia sediminis]|uniref:hypothetical protein n=1 Tax=Shimia sediminis TaxID=2497945 RepID=UPI000F8CE27E|nr:hypothetical protein [Shimia sediminis]
MLYLIFLTALGAALIPAIASDDSDTPTEEDNPDDWDSDQIRVTEEGEAPELVDAEVVSRDAQEGVDLDQLIETNIFDDVSQFVDAGDGLDVVEIGVGDDVDTLSDSEDTADDIEGEDGDHITLTVTADALEDLPVPAPQTDGIPGLELPAASHIVMGSEDTLEIAFEEGIGGHLEVVEVETDWRVSHHFGSRHLESALIFYIPEGESLDGLIDEDSHTDYGHEFYWELGLTDEDFGGIRLIGVIDLGEWMPDLIHEVDDTVLEGYDLSREAPEITSNLPIVSIIPPGTP